MAEYLGQVPCQSDPELFFASDGAKVRAARRMCEPCPIAMQCLAKALEAREEFGIWGGSTPAMRNRAVGEYDKTVRNVKCPNQLCLAAAPLLRARVETVTGGRWPTKRIITCTKCGLEWTALKQVAEFVEAQHGKVGTYRNHGCRCEACTKANSDIYRNHPARREAAREYYQRRKAEQEQNQ